MSESARVPPSAAYAASVLLHAALFAAIWTTPVQAKHEMVHVDIIETAEQKPPPEEPPKPEPPKQKPRKVAVVSPPDAPPPPNEEPPPPPPPNEPPAATEDKPPVRIGITMSSTSSTGGFAAPVGNTLYGKAPEKADDPNTVKPYRSDKYAALTDVTSMPETISFNIPRAEYPEEAKRAGIEGTVLLKIVVDESGRVVEATVLKDPGYDLGRAAPALMKKYARFKPAMREGEPVATELTYTLHFELN